MLYLGWHSQKRGRLSLPADPQSRAYSLTLGERKAILFYLLQSHVATLLVGLAKRLRVFPQPLPSPFLQTTSFISDAADQEEWGLILSSPLSLPQIVHRVEVAHLEKQAKTRGNLPCPSDCWQNRDIIPGKVGCVQKCILLLCSSAEVLPREAWRKKCLAALPQGLTLFGLEHSAFPA